MFHNFGKEYQTQGGGDWGGWTPPWLEEDGAELRGRRGHHRGEHGRRGPHHGEHEGRERGFGRRGPFGPGRPFEEGRHFFGRGDVKYVVLELLSKQPMHGYEVMKALEEQSGGFYTPSTGTIYPTLQMLADRDFVTVSEAEGKKTYSITDAGRAFLAEQQKEAEGFAGPFRGRGFRGREGFHRNPAMQALGSEAAEVARLFAIAARASLDNPDQLARIRTLLATTRQDLSDLIYGTNQEQPAQASETPGGEQA